MHLFYTHFEFIFEFVISGTVRVWHANTYRLESTLNYGLERVWTIACQRGSNNVALGYDEGSIMIKVGKLGYILTGKDHIPIFANKVVVILSILKNIIKQRK